VRELFKNVKREEIHASTYRDFEELRERMEEFIDGYYNVCRLHSALHYRSPEDLEKEAYENPRERQRRR
jgi:putative transposase